VVKTPRGGAETDREEKGEKFYNSLLRFIAGRQAQWSSTHKNSKKLQIMRATGKAQIKSSQETHPAA
jgi:hypothetical protein